MPLKSLATKATVAAKVRGGPIMTLKPWIAHDPQPQPLKHRRGWGERRALDSHRREPLIFEVLVRKVR